MDQHQSAPRSNPVALAPILVFLALYLGSGITFEYILKIENGFYQTPAIVIFLIALAVACPRGFRAVGMANHNNPIPIFIPCHRVVGADGSLTGYGGGLELKKALLALEGHHF